MLNYRVRSATKIGSKHTRNGINNQDSNFKQRFSVPSLMKNYLLALVCDGCTGHPGVSHTEVGAWLIPLFINARFQHLVCRNTKLSDIPEILYIQCTEYLRLLSTATLSPMTIWNDGVQEERHKAMDPVLKFIHNYLAATVLGAMTDFQDIVFFTAGDGVLFINDDLTIINQQNQPLYPATQIDQVPLGFELKIFKAEDVKKWAITSDGLVALMQDTEFRKMIFEYQPDNPVGLQYWLNKAMRSTPELMTDDCTIITGELVEVSSKEK